MALGIDCMGKQLYLGDEVCFIDPNWEGYNSRLQAGTVCGISDKGNIIVKSLYHDPFEIQHYKICKVGG